MVPDAGMSLPFSKSLHLPARLLLQEDKKTLPFRLQRRDTVKCAEACIARRLFTKFILDREQAVVLGYTLAACRCPRFDLPAIGRNDEISDSGILSLP